MNKMHTWLIVAGFQGLIILTLAGYLFWEYQAQLKAQQFYITQLNKVVKTAQKKLDQQVQSKSACKEAHYFATTSQGVIAKLSPLDKPNFSRSGIVNWTSEIITKALMLSFHNYEMKLKLVTSEFSQDGWRDFTRALTEAQIIENLTTKNMVMTPRLLYPPVVLEEKNINGKYTWFLEVPISLKLQAGSFADNKVYVEKGKQKKVSMNVRIAIERSGDLSNPAGVVITKWIQRKG